jgi:SAM-dependent methyltransferase
MVNPASPQAGQNTLHSPYVGFFEDCAVNVTRLQQLIEPPPLFEPGEPLFWDDPHISAQMLAFHLDPDTDIASRIPETINHTVNWLAAYLEWQRGNTVLDLGCGPGLYAIRLAERGLNVTGIDFSQRSIDYARKAAAERDLSIDYRYQNYLTLDEPPIYDAALLIYGDLCPLAPAQRDTLLDNVYRALKPGGHLVFDVTTRLHRARHGLQNRWYAVESGFWKPGPHLVLEQGFDYPDHDTYLDQYVVVEADGTISVYRNWFLDYALDTILPVIQAPGFTVRGYWNDLTGTPYTPDTEWIGIVAQKVILA